MKKTKFTFYGCWEYEREEAELNRASENGWQLLKGGCFHSQFQKNMDQHFIYKLDFQPEMKDEERYQEIFADQGWEYINTTYNGWIYFRKPYREDMSEEEKELYSDQNSLKEMQSRFIRIMIVLCFMEGVLFVREFLDALFTHSLSSVFMAIATGLFTLGLAGGIVCTKLNREQRRCRIPLHASWFMPIILVIMIFAIFLP